MKSAKSTLYKDVNILGISSAFGSGCRGQAYSAEALRVLGLVSSLKKLGINVTDFGNVYTQLIANNSKINIKYFDSLLSCFAGVDTEVTKVHANRGLSLILSADHSNHFPIFRAFSRLDANTGLLWLDSHPDINTPLTTPSGNFHGMVVAALLGMIPEVAKDRVLEPEHLVYVGLRSIDREELSLLHKLGIKYYDINMVQRLGVREVMDEALEYLSKKVKRISVSFDFDVCDSEELPAVASPKPGGLSIREARYILSYLGQQENIAMLDFCELNSFSDVGLKSSLLARDLIISFFNPQCEEIY